MGRSRRSGAHRYTVVFLAFLAVSGAVFAEPCPCGPIEDIELLPEAPTPVDLVTVRAAIQDGAIVDEDAAVVEVDLPSRTVDLTVVTTDVVGDGVDQVHFYSIGQLPPGTWTFNLLVAGLNPPPTEPPGPWVPYTTTFVVSGDPSAPVPAMGWPALLILLGGTIAIVGAVLSRQSGDRLAPRS